MNIQAEKIALTKLLLNTNNPSIIQSIKDVFLKAATADFWDELSYEQQQEIKQGDRDILEEKTTSYEIFMKNHRE